MTETVYQRFTGPYAPYPHILYLQKYNSMASTMFKHPSLIGSNFFATLSQSFQNFNSITFDLIWNWVWLQWRIQDFSKVGANYGRGRGENLLFSQIFLKTVWTWRKLGRGASEICLCRSAVGWICKVQNVQNFSLEEPAFFVLICCNNL